jgi:hypothetical protein
VTVAGADIAFPLADISVPELYAYVGRGTIVDIDGFIVLELITELNEFVLTVTIPSTFCECISVVMVLINTNVF